MCWSFINWMCKSTTMTYFYIFRVVYLLKKHYFHCVYFRTLCINVQFFSIAEMSSSQERRRYFCVYYCVPFACELEPVLKFVAIRGLCKNIVTKSCIYGDGLKNALRRIFCYQYFSIMYIRNVACCLRYVLEHKEEY